MDDEFNPITSRHMFAALAVVAFGWGALWAGSKGAQIAFNSSRSASETNVAAALTAAVSSPSPSVSASINSSFLSAPAVSAVKSPSSLTIMIGGDVMFDRNVRLLGQKYGYDSLLASTAPLFSSADIVAVNLEGPITSNPSKTLLANGRTTKALIFTFAPKSAEALANAGITLVSLANNHADNFGAAGLAETKKWLAQAGVQWFGDPSNASSSEAVISKNGINVAFVGYHSFQPGFDRILADVARLSASGDFVIVMPHWGVEYAATATPGMKSQARQLVAAGASAIIGSHPHVIEEHVSMGNVPVFYSLGNLLFDQYFDPDVMAGNIVSLRVTKSGTAIKIDDIKVYQTSTASRRSVTVDMQPTDIPL